VQWYALLLTTFDTQCMHAFKRKVWNFISAVIIFPYMQYFANKKLRPYIAWSDVSASLFLSLLDILIIWASIFWIVHLFPRLFTLTLLNFLNGLVELPFWNCPLSILGISRWNFKVKSASGSRAWSDSTNVKTGLALLSPSVLAGYGLNMWQGYQLDFSRWQYII
jgi:hypothetical protein